MDHDQFVWNVNYWLEQLEKENKHIEETNRKLMDLSLSEIDIKDLYRIRESLMAYGSFVTLLREDLEMYKKSRRPFYKRILRMR